MIVFQVDVYKRQDVSSVYSKGFGYIPLVISNSINSNPRRIVIAAWFNVVVVCYDEIPVLDVYKRQF